MGTRDNILDAACAIVREQGVGRLTLDEAARVAGLSKGGVLYHFKSKDDLIAAMVQAQIGQCDRMVQQHYDAEAPGPYRWARALVRTAFDPKSPGNDPIGSALLAAVSINPELVTPIRQMYDRWTERLKSDSPDFHRAVLVAMAMDGMYFEKILGLAPPATRPQRP